MQAQTESDLFNWQHIHDDRGFWDYHRDNPEIYERFKATMYELLNIGHRRLSADGVLHFVRISAMKRGLHEQYKINNNYSAGYARLFIKDHPQYDDAIQLRQLKAATNKGV